jgi:hypothetical protein
MKVLLAEYASPEAVVAAARAASETGHEIVDAFTPFPVEDLADVLPAVDRGMRFIMLVSGLLIAGLCYLLEWWTAVVAYPFDSGGRPFHSWPVFFLFPFEFGVLGAAVCGLVAFFLKSGLPRLNDPIFESELHRHSHVDGFLLAVREPESEVRRNDIRALLLAQGASATREAEL